MKAKCKRNPCIGNYCRVWRLCQVQIPGNGLHYAEAGRLWLRSEDNDSVGLTLLPTLLFLHSQQQPKPVSPGSLFKKKRPFSQTMRKLAGGGFDHRVMQRCVTGRRHRYLVSPLKDSLLRRLVGKTSDTAAADMFYCAATSHYLYLHLQQ